MALALLLVPWVFALRGPLRGTLYTYAWTGMLSLLHFAHGVSAAWTLAGDRPYWLTEIALSLMWFAGPHTPCTSGQTRTLARPAARART